MCAIGTPITKPTSKELGRGSIALNEPAFPQSALRCEITHCIFTIRYRRPLALWSAVSMAVSGADAAMLQVKRLKALGYTIIDVEAGPTGAQANGSCQSAAQAPLTRSTI
jgi:hypothetical protein